VNSTFGRDLLDERFDGSRYAFTIRHGERRIAIISDEFYFRAKMDGTHAQLHQIFSDDPEKDIVPKLQKIWQG